MVDSELSLVNELGKGEKRRGRFGGRKRRRIGGRKRIEKGNGDKFIKNMNKMRSFQTIFFLNDKRFICLEDIEEKAINVSLTHLT